MRRIFSGYTSAFPVSVWSVLCLLAPVALASDPALDALQRLNSRLPKAAGAVEWRNFSTQPDAEFVRLRELFASMRARNPEPGAALRITLSESIDKLLLAAEADGKVWIEAWPRAGRTGNSHPARLVREVLLTHPAPMLDALQHSSGKWIVLQPRALVAGERVIPFILPRPLPRDPRGRLEANANGVTVLLPGMRCESDLDSARCGGVAQENTPVAGRNFFEDRLGRYYSEAALGGLALRTSLDGKLHAFTAAQDAGSAEGWGELVARVESACGVMALATRASGELIAIDWKQGDGPVELTPPVAAGVVTAMWSASDGKSVTVISRIAESGEYEASQVSVACNR